MEHKLIRIDRELVYRGSVLDIYKDTMELPNGKKEYWDFVDHRKGGACIVPVLPDGRQTLLLLADSQDGSQGLTGEYIRVLALEIR